MIICLFYYIIDNFSSRALNGTISFKQIQKDHCVVGLIYYNSYGNYRPYQLTVKLEEWRNDCRYR